jgi:O-antigen/teichoic acid export membrane protein
MSGTVAGETRRYGRAAGLLTLAIGSAGLFTYLFFALASHSLSADDYGEIVVLWSVVFISVSTLFRPVEQLLSRTLAELEAHGESTGHALRVAARIQLALAVAFVALALLFREPLRDDLLSGEEALYWVLVAAVVAFGASFFARGFLAGSGRFGFYALLLLVDGIGRFAFALVVAVGIADGHDVVALGIVFGPALSLLVVPLALLRRRAGARPRPAGVGDAAAPEFTLARGGHFAAAVLLIMLSEQVLLNGGPLFVRAADGAAAAGFIFNVLMVVRAPVVLFQAITASLLPHLTRMRSAARVDGDAFGAAITATLRAIAVFGAAVLAVLAIAGPELMQLAFGDKFAYDRAGLLIVGAGMVLYLSAGTLNQAALARGRARRASLCWLATAAAFAAWNLVSPLSDFRTVEVGFAGAAALLCGLLALLYRSRRAAEGLPVEPGSPEELELRLAAGDDAA